MISLSILELILSILLFVAIGMFAFIHFRHECRNGHESNGYYSNEIYGLTEQIKFLKSFISMFIGSITLILVTGLGFFGYSSIVSKSEIESFIQDARVAETNNLTKIDETRRDNLQFLNQSRIEYQGYMDNMQKQFERSIQQIGITKKDIENDLGLSHALPKLQLLINSDTIIENKDYSLLPGDATIFDKISVRNVGDGLAEIVNIHLIFDKPVMSDYPGHNGSWFLSQDKKRLEYSTINTIHQGRTVDLQSASYIRLESNTQYSVVLYIFYNERTIRNTIKLSVS